MAAKWFEKKTLTAVFRIGKAPELAACRNAMEERGLSPQVNSNRRCTMAALAPNKDIDDHVIIAETLAVPAGEVRTHTECVEEAA